MSIILNDLINYLDKIAPPHYQEEYDNAGLIVGMKEMKVKGVLVCLDSTEDVIDEAIALGCNVVVAHHPIIFRGLKQIIGSDYIQKTIIKAIKNDIAIFAIHTNLDNVLHNGVNEKISQQLDLREVRILKEKGLNDEISAPIGAGIIGLLEKPMKEYDFMHYLKEKMSLSVIRHTVLLNRDIYRIALCGGAGGFLLNDAISQNADIFITSDYKYHEFFDANDKIVIADIGHYESEKFTIELLQLLIKQNFSNFAAHCTKVNTNPIKYF